MRTVTVILIVLTSAALALGQAGARGVPGYCSYGCGPYVPLVTTPNVSLQTVSPSPVGASNATGGLLAGARNSTLSMITTNTDAVYTEPVWRSGGGSPIVSPAVRLPLEARAGMHEEHAEHMERGRGEPEREGWIYYSGQEPIARTAEPAGTSRSVKHATHSYTNQDVERMNDHNGEVKYDGKSEKIH